MISVPSRKNKCHITLLHWLVLSLFSFRIFLAFLAAGLFNDTVIVTLYCSVSALCLSDGSSLDLPDCPLISFTPPCWRCTLISPFLEAESTLHSLPLSKRNEIAHMVIRQTFVWNLVKQIFTQVLKRDKVKQMKQKYYTWTFIYWWSDPILHICEQQKYVKLCF